MIGLAANADVYPPHSTGSEVTHSYNSGTAPEAISVSSLAAGTYYVQVKPYNTASTNYTLEIGRAPCREKLAVYTLAAARVGTLDGTTSRYPDDVGPTG